ncbi:LysR family transcriptional regulator [Sansalvadorimonas verongulae]|uniref:LysR family transcriptional regulator n=1 Tax=Sansalvadorimonas verongulae TaxID=2172824 RepID=UPI0012BBD188|nr:LysR family transcriptional regulator [Sansalvadorimonas verongulae]MTI11804.1 LysR family transcriptional regulator [Sansalvadorimonas verongulae]
MKGTTFNQLTVFQTIVQQGSIRGAARTLKMAPPSVSQSLKHLETALGLPLFTRSTRRIDLTEAGQLLNERISGAMSELQMALETVQALSDKPFGRVSITLPRFAFQYFLKPVYGEFCERYPDVQLEISVTDEAVNLLDKGHDAGIRLGNLVEPGMVARAITAPMKDALFASDEYIAKEGMPTTLSELEQHKMIQYRFIASNQLAPLTLINNGQDVPIQMPTALIVNDTDAVVDAAEKSLGIGRIVEPMVHKQLESGTLKPVLEECWYPYPGLHVYFAQNSQKAKRIRVFIDFLIEKGQQLYGA